MILLSLLLLLTDRFSNFIEKPKVYLSSGLYFIHYSANLPNIAFQRVSTFFSTHKYLSDRILDLESRLLFLGTDLEKMASLIEENNRLRELLGSAAKSQDSVLVSEVIGIDPDPASQNILIDKGQADGVFKKQTVIDSSGLVGQVIEVSKQYSRIMLITDFNSFVPVAVLRNNLRLMLKGTGMSEKLQLLHVNPTADIKVGDLLISSGLGERFPAGYPVGSIKAIDYVEGRPFLDVTATPKSGLDRSQHLLLVFSERAATSSEKVKSTLESPDSGD